MNVLLATESVRVELVRVSWVLDSRSLTDLTVQPACADLNRPHCDRAAGFKSDGGESEAPFTLKLEYLLLSVNSKKAAPSHIFKFYQNQKNRKLQTVNLRRQI